MVSTQERRHEWFSIGEVGPEEKKSLCSFVKKKNTHTQNSFFLKIWFYYFWLCNHFSIYLWAFIKSVNDASFLQIALVNLCRNIIDHHHWAQCTEVRLNLRKNALDVGKIPKSFILTTTFFNSAFMLDEYKPINTFLTFKIEKIYYF